MEAERVDGGLVGREGGAAVEGGEGFLGLGWFAVEVELGEQEGGLVGGADIFG